MNEEWNTALARAVRDVFEALCFMMPAPKASAPPESQGASRVVLAVDIGGAGDGCLQLALSDSMVAKVASAMLGEDGPLELSEQYDAVRELANIVCGNVLPLVAGERAVFELASPRVIATQQLRLDDGGDATASVRLDEGTVAASLWLRLNAGQGAA